jgi:hypothetical protein
MKCVTVGRVSVDFSVFLGYVCIVGESRTKPMKMVGVNSILCDSKYGGFTRKEKINIAWKNMGKGPHESGKVVTEIL